MKNTHYKGGLFKLVKSRTKLATNPACPWSPDISCDQASLAVQIMGHKGEPPNYCKGCIYSPDIDKPKSQRDRDLKTVNVFFPKDLGGSTEWTLTL